jgi:hypothetical protein
LPFFLLFFDPQGTTLCSLLGRLSFPSLPICPLLTGPRASAPNCLTSVPCSAAYKVLECCFSTRSTHRRHLHLCCTVPAPEPVISQQETGHP